MANNEYVNRVDFGDETLIDISDTTAEPEDVIEGQTFYTRSGAPAIGTLGDATTTTHGLMSATDKVKLDEMDSKKAPIIIDSKSGNPIVINDGIPGLKMYDMKVSFSPKQEGTGDPSPANIRSITGWTGVNISRTGVNMLPITNKSPSVYNVSEDGTISNKSASQNYGWLNYAYRVFDTYLPAGTYTLVSVEVEEPTTTGNGATICDEDGNWIIDLSGKTGTTRKASFTLSVGKRIGVVVKCKDGAYKIAIIPGSSGEYAPYTGEMIPVSWQAEAGTIFGGTLDVLTGILTVNMARADMGSATWTIGTNGDVHWFKSSRILTGAKTLSSNSYMANIVSDRFKNIQAARIYSGEAEDNTIAQESISLANSNLRVKATSYNDDTDAFKAAMNGVYVYYELATPLTYQLTPIQIILLTGINTIWADAGTAEIAYPVDTKKYIDAGATDVQIDGNSITNNGIANIPYATNTTPGLIMTSGTVQLGSDHKLWVNNASDANIKGGTSTTSYLTPSRQDISTFYGLAKAAGANLANETVTFGQYPNSAKVAIQKMLGIYEAPWEIINEETFTNATSEDHIISVDSYGQPFELTEAIMLFELPKLSVGDVDSSKGTYGQIWFIYNNGNNYIAPEPNAFSRVAGGDAKGAWYYIQNNNGLIVSMATSSTTNTNSAAIRMRYIQGSWSKMGVFVDDGTFAITSVNIKSVVGNGRYRLYGRRK